MKKIRQKSNPYSPQQNGTAERLNSSIVEKADACFFTLKKDCADTVDTVIYLRNRSIDTGLEMTPIEMWTNKKLDISQFPNRSEDVKEYRLYDP